MVTFQGGLGIRGKKGDRSLLSGWFMTGGKRGGMGYMTELAGWVVWQVLMYNNKGKPDDHDWWSWSLALGAYHLRIAILEKGHVSSPSS